MVYREVSEIDFSATVEGIEPNPGLSEKFKKPILDVTLGWSDNADIGYEGFRVWEAGNVDLHPGRTYRLRVQKGVTDRGVEFKTILAAMDTGRLPQERQPVVAASPGPKAHNLDERSLSIARMNALKILSGVIGLPSVPPRALRSMFEGGEGLGDVQRFLDTCLRYTTTGNITEK